MAKKKGEVEMRDLISQSEAAEIRGVTLTAIGNLIRRGRLNTFTLGGHKLVFRSEVEDFEELKRGPKGRSRKGGKQ